LGGERPFALEDGQVVEDEEAEPDAGAARDVGQETDADFGAVVAEAAVGSYCQAAKVDQPVDEGPKA
jgi:hypothetical protein